MEVVSRKYASDLEEDYAMMLRVESHHEHVLILDDHGTLRWEKDKEVRALADEIGLNDLIKSFYHLGWDKNSEQYRHLYRCLGYSLSGYWEVFYWDMNHEDADEYIPKRIDWDLKKFLQTYKNFG